MKTIHNTPDASRPSHRSSLMTHHISCSMGQPFRFTLFLLLLCFLQDAHHAESAFERSPLVPQITARGGANVGWAKGKSAFLWNPAAEISSRAIFSASYSQPYGVDDLAEGLISYNRTVAGHSSLGLAWQRLSTTGYHEDRRSVAFSWGNSIGRAGIRLDHLGVGIDGFGSRTAVGLSVGGLLKINANLQIGVALSQIDRPKVSQPLPRSWGIGVGLRAAPELLLAADWQKAEDSAPQIRVGSELLAARHFILRAGMHNHPWEITVGWGLRVRSIGIDYAWVNHSSLNGTHQISVSWRFGEI